MRIPSIEGAALLFEGEGSAALLRQQGRKPIGCLALKMTDEEVVVAFQASVGGRGRIYFRSRRLPHHKDLWAWQTTKRYEIEWIAERFLPYVSRRRQEQLHACVAASRVASRRYTHSLTQEMFGKRLKDLTTVERRQYNTESHRRWRVSH